VGQERLGPSHFFIPLVLGPLNSLVWYLRYTCGLGWRMHCGAEVTESSTNKQHHLSQRQCEYRPAATLLDAGEFRTGGDLKARHRLNKSTDLSTVAV
jgi:hypothetical protein